MKKINKQFVINRKRDRKIIINFVFPIWMKPLIKYCRLVVACNFPELEELDLNYKNAGTYREPIELK